MEIKTKEQALEEIRDIEIVLEQKKHLEVENKGLIKQVEDLQAKADEARGAFEKVKDLEGKLESLAKQAESLEEKAEGIDLIQKGLKRLLGTPEIVPAQIQTPGKVVSQIDNAEVEYVIHDEGPVIEHITTTNEAGKVLWAIKKLKDQGKEPVSLAEIFELLTESGKPIHPKRSGPIFGALVGSRIVQEGEGDLKDVKFRLMKFVKYKEAKPE